MGSQFISKTTLRWGIVSRGEVSDDFVNAFNTYPDKGDQAIVAVAARNFVAAAEFAETHNIPKVFDFCQTMAASKDIDIAYIDAVKTEHYPIAMMFLENGKHVLCEKPLCLNYKQVKSLIRLAKKKNLFLMEGVWSRFSPIYLSLEKEINSEKLGEIYFVEVHLGEPISDSPKMRKKQCGSSALLELGIYTLQFAQYIFKDDPIKVSSIGELNGDGVDLADTVVLDYAGAKKAVLYINAKIKLVNHAILYGTKGRVTLEDPFYFPTSMVHVDGTTEKILLHPSKVPYSSENRAGLVFEMLEVAKCIKEDLKESPRMSHKDSLSLAELEDEIRRQIGVNFDEDNKEFP